MAKRRNAKKEKTIRNKVNARKFRKPSSRYNKRGRRWSNNNETTEEKSSENDSSKSESGTDKTVKKD